MTENLNLLCLLFRHLRIVMTSSKGFGGLILTERKQIWPLPAYSFKFLRPENTVYEHSSRPRSFAEDIHPHTGRQFIDHTGCEGEKCGKKPTRKGSQGSNRETSIKVVFVSGFGSQFPDLGVQHPELSGR